MDGNQKYIAVDPANLKVGMLVDRPLFVHLTKNGKYVRLANAFAPLTIKTHEKLMSYGKIFSTADTLNARYPDLEFTAETIKSICQKNELAPFEKNNELKVTLAPIIDKVFKNTSTGNWDPTASGLGFGLNDVSYCVFLMNRAFKFTEGHGLEYLENLSVDHYLESLRRAAIAGMFALLIDYSDYELIRQYMVAVFAEDAFADEGGGSSFPGIDDLSDRFGVVLRSASKVLGGFGAHVAFDAIPGSLNDELWDISSFARHLVYESETTGEENSSVSIAFQSRALRKVKREVDHIFGKDVQDTPAKAA